jgi:hypothetical protein
MKMFSLISWVGGERGSQSSWGRGRRTDSSANEGEQEGCVARDLGWDLKL